MIVFQCKQCGGELSVKEGDTLAMCEYCGSTQTLPSSQDEHLKGLFVRANGLRLKNAFDKAAGLYEAILQEDSTQAEAYWGLLLCEYGIEYVVDPETEWRVPTCHRLSYTPIPESENYAEAMRYADGRTKVVYQQDAEILEALRKAVAAKAKLAQPVDVFICYKESEEGDLSRRRTLDSELAGSLYDDLTEAGFKVFFARESLKEYSGEEYEPYIFAALHSAKVMLVVATSRAHIDATWVKNEWSRYLALMAADPKTKRRFVPCIKNMEPEDLPDRFMRYECANLGEPGAKDDLVRSLKKFLCTQPEPLVAPQVTVAATATVGSLMKRAENELLFGNFKEARDAFSQVLNVSVENAEAYLGTLMAKYECTTREQLREKCLRLSEDAPQLPAEKELEAFRVRWKLMNIPIETLKQFGSKFNPSFMFDFEDVYTGEKGVQRLSDRTGVTPKEVEALLPLGREALSELNRLCRELGSQREDWELQQKIEELNSGEAILKDAYFKAAMRFATGELKTWLDDIFVERERLLTESKTKRERLVAAQTCQDDVTNLLRKAVLRMFEEWCVGHNQALAATRYVHAGRTGVSILYPTNGSSLSAFVYKLNAGEAPSRLETNVNAALLQTAGNKRVMLDLDGALFVESSPIAGASYDNEFALENMAATDNSIFVIDDEGNVDVVVLSANNEKYRKHLTPNSSLRYRRLFAGPKCVAAMTDEDDLLVVSVDGTIKDFPNKPEKARMAAFGKKWALWLEKFGTLQYDGEVPEAVREWPALLSVASGDNHVVGLDCAGTVLAAGDNSAGQCNVQNWEPCFAVFAAGNYTLALSHKGKVLCTNPTISKACANLRLTPKTWNKLQQICASKSKELVRQHKHSMLEYDRQITALKRKLKQSEENADQP